MGQPILIDTIKPGATLRGIVTGPNALDQEFVVTMAGMTDTTNMSSDQALPIETTAKAPWVLHSASKLS